MKHICILLYEPRVIRLSLLDTKRLIYKTQCQNCYVCAVHLG